MKAILFVLSLALTFTSANALALRCFDPAGRLAFVVTEQGNSVHIRAVQDGIEKIVSRAIYHREHSIEIYEGGLNDHAILFAKEGGYYWRVSINDCREESYLSLRCE